MNAAAAAACFALALTFAGCAHDAGPGVATSRAALLTRLAYADDADGVAANLDVSLRSSVTRTEVAALSDAMHALGAFEGLQSLVSDPVKNEYTYRAQFERGDMDVVVRLTATGTVAAYRAFAANLASSN